MKHYAFLAAFVLLAATTLSAIPVGDSDLALGGDVRWRYTDNDGPNVGDSADSTLRIRLNAATDITDNFSAAFSWFVAGGQNDAAGEIGSTLGGTAALEHGYISWANGFGDVHIGRIPASMAGNDLLFDSEHHDGNTGNWDGAYVDFNDFGGWNLDLWYSEFNTTGTDEGTGFGITVNFDDMLGYGLHIGVADFDDDFVAGGWDAFYAGADIALSDVADIGISWIDGNNGASGNAILIEMAYAVNDEVSLGIDYATAETGSNGHGMGGFGDIDGDLIDGDMLRFDLGWGGSWSFSYITWETTGAAAEDTVLRVQYEVAL
jgi:hypothetical protein